MVDANVIDAQLYAPSSRHPAGTQQARDRRGTGAGHAAGRPAGQGRPDPRNIQMVSTASCVSTARSPCSNLTTQDIRFTFTTHLKTYRILQLRGGDGRARPEGQHAQPTSGTILRQRSGEPAVIDYGGYFRKYQPGGFIYKGGDYKSPPQFLRNLTSKKNC